MSENQAARTGPIKIASHRGGALLWPENSLPAFRASAALALDQAECDVHLSADGAVVVIHDATLDRTTEATGPVVARRAAELAAIGLRGENAGHVPLLSDMLAALRDSPVAPRIEIKPDAAKQPYPGIVTRTLAALDQAGERARAWIIGFERDTMIEAQQAGGLAGVTWLFTRPDWQRIGARAAAVAARGHGFAEIGVAAASLDAEAVAILREAGVGIGVWGADDAATIRRMIGLGVDILATDNPKLALAIRG